MSEYVRVASVSAIPQESALRVELGGMPIALARCDGRIVAVADTCTHEEASLSDGEVFDCLIECPLHGARFDLVTGAVKSLPAVEPITVYDVRVDGDDVLIRADA